MLNSKRKKFLNESPKAFHHLINDIFDDLEKNKVKIKIGLGYQVDINDGAKSSGYFQSEPEILIAIAIGKTFNKWFPVFIHEYCHFEQYIEDKKNFKSYDAPIGKVFDWINQTIKLSKKQAEINSKKAAYLELDCERRVINKIRKYGLEKYFDTKIYAQKANSYINFYLFVAEKRSWYKSKKEPYNNPSVWKKFPKKLILKNTLSEKEKTNYKKCI